MSERRGGGLDRRAIMRSAAHTANRIGVTPVERSMLTRPLQRLGDPDGMAALRKAVSGRTVLVTGASSGIGRATALRLGAAGAVVLLVARSEDELDAVRDEIEAGGGTAHVHPCDLVDLEAVDSLVKEVLETHGAVDVVINNAGLSIRRSVRRTGDRFHDFERPMALNYFSAVRLVTGLLPTMVAQRRGQVVNISSWAVQVRPSRFSGYTASKAALEAWSDCVQGEVLDKGVVFTNIRMPLVRTPMIAPTKIYRRVPALSPEQAAAVVGDAVVTRSRRFSPLASRFLSIAEALSPRAGDRIRSNAV